MPASADAPTTGFEIDRAAHTLRFVRDFDAPREDVFDAWTLPEEMAEWWNAADGRLTVCEIDLRVGGAFRFASKNHTEGFSGVYHEIDRPGRLVFEALGAMGYVLIAEHGAGTRMTVEIVCPSAEHFENFVQVGVAPGTSETLDNLVAYIAGKG